MKNIKLPALEHYKWDGNLSKAVPRGVVPVHMIHFITTREQKEKENDKLEESKRLSKKEIINKVREEYRKLTDDEKQKFILLQEEDRARFQKQTEEFEKKGYFTMANGAKSNTVQEKPKARSKTPTSLPKKQKTMGKKKK